MLRLQQMKDHSRETEKRRTAGYGGIKEVAWQQLVVGGCPCKAFKGLPKAEAGQQLCLNACRL